MLGNMLFHLTLFCCASLYQSSICMIICRCQGLYFVTPENSFIRLLVYILILLAIIELHSCWIPSYQTPAPYIAIPLQCSPLLLPVSPLLRASICSHILAVCSAVMCENCKYLVLPQVIAFYCYLCKTILVAHKG